MNKYGLLFVTLLMSFSVFAAQDLNNEVDKLVNSYMQKYQLPGFGIAIVDRDKTLYQKSYGVKNIYTDQAVTDDSLFHMASVTKTFVGTALMQLQERGLLDIHQPILRYLPYFVLGDSRYDQITVAQAASHISGMKDFDSEPWHDADYDAEALERFVRDFVGLKYLDRDPGVAYEYCNTLYEVLGDVIAKVSGESFEDYVKNNILIPLGMKSSTLLFTEVDKRRLTAAHALKNNKVIIRDIFPYNRMHAPSSTLVSSIEDMSQFLKMYLNQGELNGERLLSQKSIETMWAPAANGRFNNVGVSWHRQEHDGELMIYHGGSDVGYKSFVMIFPKQGIAAVILTNSLALPYNLLSSDLANILLAHSL